MMNFDEAPEFKKDVKAFKKRVPTLQSDLKRIRKRVTSLYALGDDMTENDLLEFRTKFFNGKVATILPGSTDELETVKIRIDSDTDQYRNKLRLVFIAIKREDRILLVELYSKNDKAREDDSRIRRYV